MINFTRTIFYAKYAQIYAFFLANTVVIVYNLLIDMLWGLTKMISRKTAREQAFILVFEKSFIDETVDDILSMALELNDFQDDNYTTEIFKGVVENSERIDSIISENSKRWDISRIGRVALSLMRVAIFEILFREDIPVSVSINEAVELCKKYATENDSAFLNGVLGTIARNYGNED